jgi:hypothetical protein
MPDAFPAVGHKYLVDFRSATARFRVQLDFASETSLTYTGIDANGNPIPNSSQTVNITVEPIRDQLFLVTWQESDGTTVVHLEDYKMNTIITNITSPGTGTNAPDFSKFHGTMTQIS